MTEFLRWTEIPAYLCEGLSDHEARMLNLMENLQRKCLNVLEEARAVQKLYPDGCSLIMMLRGEHGAAVLVNVSPELLPAAWGKSQPAYRQHGKGPIVLPTRTRFA